MEGALFPFFKASKPLLGRSRTSLGFWPSSTSMPQTSPQSSLVQSLQERIDSLYKPEEYPACRDQAERWSRTKPLAGLTVLDATPVFDNTFTKYVALMRAGARLLAGIDDVMPRSDDSVAYLKAAGIPVVRPETVSEPIDLVLDCAGAFASIAPRLGYVELTRSGVAKYRDAVKPVFVADAGRIKRIETCLGTGESYFRAMAQLGYGSWRGRKLVIFGSGKVGTGLITYAHRNGCDTTVVTRLSDITPETASLAQRVIAADDAAAIREAVLAADAVVTATGVAGALKDSCPAEVFMASHALIANMGVEDEFGEALPADRVLQGKKPLNFILHDPTRIDYIDATMALHNAGVLYLVEHPELHGKAGLIDPPAALEEEILAVSRRDGRIADELEGI